MQKISLCKASDAGLASQEALRAAEAAILESLEATMSRVGWLVGWVGLGCSLYARRSVGGYVFQQFS